MMHVKPLFVLYALLLDPSCCPRAHTVLSGTVEPVLKKKEKGLALSIRCITEDQMHHVITTHFMRQYFEGRWMF